MSRPQRFTAADILCMLNTDDSDVETPPGTDDEDDDYNPNPPSSSEDSDEESDEDLPDPGPSTSTSTNGRPQSSTKNRYRSMDKEFQPPNSTFTGTPPEFPHRIKTAYEYFRSMIQEMIRLLVDATNLYSTQKTGTCLNLKVKDMEMVIGMFFRMGLTKMLGVRRYYEMDTRYSLVADVMACNKLLDVLRFLHVADNESVIEETKRKDKLWKIRPWLTLFRDQCLKVDAEEFNSVDEMIIPFRGKFSGIKQYIRGKPHPWGFKVWCRTSSSGILCDFEVYTGAVLRSDRDILGVGGGVVSRLASTLPPQQNYKIFADNFFTSMALLEDLKQKGIQYVGTVRSNRLGDTKLPTNKEMMKKGRGEISSRVEVTTNVVVVKWFDTKAVTVASTYLGPDPVNEARRWIKSQRQFQNIPLPYSM